MPNASEAPQDSSFSRPAGPEVGESPYASYAYDGGAPGYGSQDAGGAGYGGPASYEAPSYSPPPKRGGFLNTLGSLLFTVVAVIVLVFLLRTFVFQSYDIPSGSMEETIMTGDLVFSEKVTYYFGDPQRGDIVTFLDPEIPSRTLIKRVIATGGQTVDLRDGDVYIDGVRQDEPYTDGKPSYPLAGAGGRDISYPYTVPEGELWVMGDNRTNSQDSRYFGSVPVSSVTGKAVFKYWPIESIGPL